MLKNLNKRLSVAPMMDWTDRHCRYLHRLLSRHTLLYTEMVTAAAIVHGDPARLLRFDPAEHPLALQLGGADPGQLAQATRIAGGFGFDEFNLNIGCPSDRVQSGMFGAVLMKSPALVSDCVHAMIDNAGQTEVTVKCRIGVDDQEPRDILPGFIEMLETAGVRRVIIHARKAWLEGLSPKENRQVPPLDHALVYAIKQDFPELEIIINGGISSLAQAKQMLSCGVDGVMIGRAAYHDPFNTLARADIEIFGKPGQKTAHEVVNAMLPYINAHLAAGGRLNQVTRHMMGLFNGRPGARQWRRILSEEAHRPGASAAVVTKALGAVDGSKSQGATTNL